MQQMRMKHDIEPALVVKLALALLNSQQAQQLLAPFARYLVAPRHGGARSLNGYQLIWAVK